MKELIRDKKNLWLLVWPAAFIVYLTARYIPGAAEYVYAKGIYRAYSAVMSFITGWIPFSLAEILLILFPFTILAIIIAGFVKIVGSSEKCKQTVFLIRRLLIVTGAVFLWYMIGCGTNYYRYEFSRYSGLTVRPSDKQELYELCMDLSEKAAQNRVEEYMTDSERSKAGREAMTKLAENYSALEGFYPRPKSVVFSKTMSRFGITGVYFPWTVEANVNVDIPLYSRAVTICHELSHLRGFMREDEANFIGYLGCINSDSKELKYSGYMLALIYATNRLYSEDKNLYYEVAKTYTPGMLDDLIEDSKYWKQFEGSVTEQVGEKVNNAYLIANNQTDGTKSYGRMVDLLLAEWRNSR